MNRRRFLQQSLATASTCTWMHSNTGALFAHPAAAKVAGDISNQSSPMAIAMWDFSWLLRHHRLGSFEDWDTVLAELVMRGYNAVRADVFPHLVARNPDGKIQHEYYFPKGDWHIALWGNQYTVTVNPRKGLVEFLQKCRNHGVHVGLSTWFLGPGTEQIKGIDGFVRVWDETLTLIQEHGLLDTALYVDLLNEYPMFHGFTWLAEELERIKQRELNQIEDPERRQRQAHEWVKNFGQYTPQQRNFYCSFLTEVIMRLRKKWPQLSFFASQTYNSSAPWSKLDFSQFDLLDLHLWFVMEPTIAGQTQYFENIHSMKNDMGFKETQKLIHQVWNESRPQIIEWMDQRMAEVAVKGKELNVPYGNTEGWGAISWMDHPDLRWDFIKESAEICATLGVKHGYKFNCTSNFTHPHFPGYWNDVHWHKKVTSIIRNGI